MRKSHSPAGPVFWGVLLFASCTALPSPALEETPPPVVEEAPPLVVEEAPGELLPAAVDEQPEAILPPPEPGEDVLESLDEPVLDLAEASTPESFPPEEGFSPNLPEPAMPDFPAPALGEAEPVPEPPVVSPEPPVSPPVPEAPALAAIPETPPEPLPVSPPVSPPPPPEPPPVSPPPPESPPVSPPPPEPPPVSPPPPPEPPPVSPPPPEPPPVSPPPPEPPRFIRPAEDEPPPVEREAPVSPPDFVPALPVSPSPLTADGAPSYSRRVSLRVGQIVEVPFRGAGWVYLGEQDSQRGISYLSRRSDDEGQSFLLRAEKPGVYTLKFYKQDFIRDYILNDYVEVTVSPAPEAGAWLSPPVEPSLVVAEPRWPPVGESFLPGPVNSGDGLPAAGAALLPRKPPERAAPPPGDGGPSPVVPSAVPEPAPAETGNPPRVLPRASAADDGVVAVVPPTAMPPAAPGESRGAGETEPDEYLRRVREEYQAGRTGEALGLLDQFREHFPGGSDEAWWLYGQVLEAPGPGRDIRAALDYYRRLIREYPQSPRYDEARRRAAYLERYYFNIP